MYAADFARGEREGAAIYRDIPHTMRLDTWRPPSKYAAALRAVGSELFARIGAHR